MINNLNDFQLDNDGNFSDVFVDNSIVSGTGVEVYFRNLEKKLLNHIAKADAVFGAVAWLTNYSILDALAKKDSVSLIVQKEDFLRPDIDSSNNFKSTLQNKYNALKCNLERYSFDNILKKVSVCCDPAIDPVRCVGNHNKDKSPAFPRMHNKFLVFAKVEGGQDQYDYVTIKPYGVWTGSFNLTRNSNASLENALYITEPEIVQAYFKEYGQIAAMSESLDWSSDWAAPEWRIGT